MLVAVDPTSGSAIGAYAESTPDEVAGAASAAAEAGRDPRLADPARRVSLLRGISSRLGDGAPELVDRYVDETGLTRERATAELARTCGQLDAFALALEQGELDEPIIDSGGPDVRRALVPLGPVAVFGASNFPLAFGVAGGDTASALAAGCPVLAKGHPSQPGVNQLVGRCVGDAVAASELPAGTFTNLQSAEIAIGEAMVEAPEIEAVAFTGSLRGGRALFDLAARRPRPIPVFAEMGSVNPVVISETALLRNFDQIASGLTAAVVSSAGQLCTKPGIVLVPAGGRGDAFSAEITTRLAQAGPLPMLNEGLLDGLARSLGELVRHPAVQNLTPGAGPSGPGFRCSPAAFETLAPALVDDPVLRVERFGPAVLLVRWANIAELAAAVSSLGGQLSVALHVVPEQDRDLIEQVLPVCQRLAGRLVFDGFPTGVPVGWATQHGGPFPATTARSTTSVGITAARRFLCPVAWQEAPDALLPPALKDANPLGLLRRIDGALTRAPVRRARP